MHFRVSFLLGVTVSNPQTSACYVRYSCLFHQQIQLWFYHLGCHSSLKITRGLCHFPRYGDALKYRKRILHRCAKEIWENWNGKGFYRCMRSIIRSVLAKPIDRIHEIAVSYNWCLKLQICRGHFFGSQTLLKRFYPMYTP